MQGANPYLRDAQRETPAAYCGRCGGELYRGEVLYTWEGVYICSECMEEEFNTMTTREKAELLGAYPVPAALFSRPGGCCYTEPHH